MSLPIPINWLQEGLGNANWFLYQGLCGVISKFPDCETIEEFISLFGEWFITFEVQYPSLINSDLTIPQVKLRIYQQLLEQLPLETGDVTYDLSDIEEALSVNLSYIDTFQTTTEFMNDTKFIINIFECLSLGMKVCNYQDTAIAAMRETMTREWLLAQKDTPFFLHKNSLMKLLKQPPGDHGFKGLGSLFG
jgi:hypothetical protein